MGSLCCIKSTQKRIDRWANIRSSDISDDGPYNRLTEMVKIVHHFAIHGKKSQTHSSDLVELFHAFRVIRLKAGGWCSQFRER